MFELTTKAIGFLNEVEAAARKALADLGYVYMQGIIDDVVALRDHTFPSESALTHIYIPQKLGIAGSKKIDAIQIRDFIKNGESQYLLKMAEHIIQFEDFKERWMKILANHEIYQE